MKLQDLTCVLSGFKFRLYTSQCNYKIQFYSGIHSTSLLQGGMSVVIYENKSIFMVKHGLVRALSIWLPQLNSGLSREHNRILVLYTSINMSSIKYIVVLEDMGNYGRTLWILIIMLLRSCPSFLELTTGFTFSSSVLR